MNDQNNFSKRTVNTVNTILRANGITIPAYNSGDGRKFIIDVAPCLTLRVKIKKAGFILLVGNAGDTSISFKTY